MSTNVIRVAVSILILALHLPGSGQIVLDAFHNAPMKEYRYVMDTAIFPYHIAIPGGPDLDWDLTELIRLNDTSSQYFTGNPNYNSFPGIQVHDYPSPDDTTCLYSDNAIYRVTESCYSLEYIAVTYPFGSGTFVEQVSAPILTYPFQYQKIMYQDTSYGQNIGGNDIMTIRLKKSDAWGTLILPDTIISDVLRIYTYNCYDVYLSHSGYGTITEKYEWFDAGSEVPILKVVVTDNYDWYLGMFTHSYDTSATIYNGKIYQPCTIGIQESGKKKSFTTFPCPAGDVFYLDSEMPLERVEIYKPTGEFLFVFFPPIGEARKTEIRTNAANMSSGMYLVRAVFGDGSTAWQKIIIAR